MRDALTTLFIQRCFVVIGYIITLTEVYNPTTAQAPEMFPAHMRQ